jgi:hypothetical protein
MGGVKAITGCHGASISLGRLERKIANSADVFCGLGSSPALVPPVRSALGGGMTAPLQLTQCQSMIGMYIFNNLQTFDPSEHIRPSAKFGLPLTSFSDLLTLFFRSIS